MERFDKKLNAQDIINAIPGGVAIYKVSTIFETVYYSDGVSALSGYSREEYDLLIKQDAANLIYHEDTAMVIREMRAVLKAGKSASFEFRKQHRDGHIVWVNVYARKIGEDGGYPLYSTIFPPSNRPRKSWPMSSILFPAVSRLMILMIYKIPGACFVPMVLPNFSAAVTRRSCSVMPQIPGA